MKAQLCKCLKCGAIMIDKNPSDQPEFEVPENVKEMTWHTFNDDYPNGCFWGCDYCADDAYLIDITDISELTP